MGNSILRLEQLAKSYRSHWTFRAIEAVRAVSLEVFRGESFGFLGHNGAGKTTTMKCIVGLIHPTQGKIWFDGEQLRNPGQRSMIGYLPELPYFYDHLSVEETLDFFARLHGIAGRDRTSTIREAAERVGIADRLRSPVGALSKGLQQRLAFAQAVINRPSLLLLDEPFSGLDPLGRRDMRTLLMELKREGCTLFLSSHILPDVEEICDRVAIMAKGELKSTFHLRDMPELFGDHYELDVIMIAPRPDLEQALRAESLSASLEPHPEGQLLRCSFTDYKTIASKLPLLAGAGVKITRLERAGRRLEEIFVQLTTNAAQEAAAKCHSAAADGAGPTVDASRARSEEATR